MFGFEELTTPQLRMDERTISLVAKAHSRYRIRKFQSKDQEACLRIFIEGLFSYVGVWGDDARKEITVKTSIKIEPHSTLAPRASSFDQIQDNESGKHDFVMPERYRQAFLDYIKNASQSTLMADIANHWRSSEGACFLVAEDIETGEVVATTGIQPVQMMGDIYSWWVNDVIEKYQLTTQENLERFVATTTAEDVQRYWATQFDEQRDRNDNALYSVARTHEITNVISQQLIDEVCDQFEKDVLEGRPVFNGDSACDKEPHDPPTSPTSSVDSPRSLDESSDKNDLHSLLPPAPVVSLNDSLDFSRAQELFGKRNRYLECEYRRIFVSDKCRGTGLAQLLMAASNELSAKVFGFHAAHLTTSNAMPSAMYFYRKCAFREVYFSYTFDSGFHWPETHFRWSFTPYGALANPLRDTVSNPMFK